MKQKKVSQKRLEELKNLYQNQEQPQNRFKIKAKTGSKTYNNIKKTRPLSTKELLFSLLLTFVIITIQLFISQFF